MYHNNFIIHESNKMYRWREQGFFKDDNGYYHPRPEGYILVDDIDWTLPYSKRFSSPLFEGLRQLTHLVKVFGRTLIMPALRCPPDYNLTRCTLCAWNDLCCYGFQNSIDFKFKAHVRSVGECHVANTLRRAIS